MGAPLTVRRLSTCTSIVSATGDVDGETPSLMEHLVAEELAGEPAQLVLELSCATSVDSVFVQALVGASALAGECDRSFCLVASPASPVVTALAAADLIERFEIFSSVSEAMLHR